MTEWTTQKKYDLYWRAIKVWGVQAQVDMVVEELAECIVATQKLFKREYSEQRRKDLASEVADVKIMIAELEYILDHVTGMPDDSVPSDRSFCKLVEEQMDYKHDRTKSRVVAAEVRLQNRPDEE
jgi:hypothetical protein